MLVVECNQNCRPLFCQSHVDGIAASNALIRCDNDCSVGQRIVHGDYQKVRILAICFDNLYSETGFSAASGQCSSHFSKRDVGNKQRDPVRCQVLKTCLGIDVKRFTGPGRGNQNAGIHNTGTGSHFLPPLFRDKFHGGLVAFPLRVDLST